ncbi:serine/threonine-protein kinase STY13-like [Hibiscus syriacus]|uniref:serine/threonine-protein kinase STY13-like n=1 Tax=Hibiscus syriacus TaxID=106335 RepID=UPI001921B9C7|nr:serine/threonine-protein kinase STY13-like [Hibiscus syriacus]
MKEEGSVGVGRGSSGGGELLRSSNTMRRQEWEIDPSKLVIKGVIARGTFGTVHRGIYDGQDVAVLRATMGSSELNLQTEHGHIGMPSNVCCVVVEYCPGGALKSYLIKNRRRKLAFKVVVQITLDLARGLSYLHSKKIHRDVKTENMLLDKSRTVKIADFGSLDLRHLTLMT